MKVRELMAVLRRADPEAEVVLLCGEHGGDFGSDIGPANTVLVGAENGDAGQFDRGAVYLMSDDAHEAPAFAGRWQYGA